MSKTINSGCFHENDNRYLQHSNTRLVSCLKAPIVWQLVRFM